MAHLFVHMRGSHTVSSGRRGDDATQALDSQVLRVLGLRIAFLAFMAQTAAA